MKNYRHKATEATEFLNSHIQTAPQIGVITGTGLGQSAASMNISASFDYKDIPHFPISTVESHMGRLVFVDMCGKKIMAMQGRFHLYEGYSPLDVSFPIRVMQELGVKTVIISNAAGGLNPKFRAGDVMIISDHINLTGSNPLIGPNEDDWGIRFPDMTRAYDQDLVELAETIGKEKNIVLQKGVYAGLKGPSLETPAEIRYLRTIGADTVGFSTVQEVIAAVHARIRVLGMSIITNTHDPHHPAPATVEEVVAVANEAAPRLESIVKDIVDRI